MGMRRDLVVAPQVLPERWRISVTQALVFALKQLSFTPWYMGADWNCSLKLFTMMLISRVASLMFLVEHGQYCLDHAELEAPILQI